MNYFWRCLILFALIVLTINIATAQETGYQPITATNVGQLVEVGTLENQNEEGYLLVALNQNGSVIAAATYHDNISQIDVWNTVDLTQIASIKVSGTILDVDINADGTRLAANIWDFDALGDTEITGVPVWDIQTGRELFRLDKPSDIYRVFDVAFTPDGMQLVTASADFTEQNFGLRVWDVSTGKALTTIGNPPDNISLMAFSGDGSLVAGASDNILRVWDVSTDTVLSTFTYNPPLPEDGSPLPGNYLLSESIDSQDDSIFVDISFTVSSDPKEISYVYSYVDGDSYETTDPISIENGKFSLPASDDITCDCEFTSQTKATCDISMGSSGTRGTADHQPINFPSIAFNPDGSLVAAASIDSTIQVWNVAGETVDYIIGESYPAEYDTKVAANVAFSSDGTVLITLITGGELNFHDTATKSLLFTLEAHEWGPRLAMNGDGTMLVTLGEPSEGDGNWVRLWAVPAS